MDSAECLVMMETISVPPGNSTTTSALTEPIVSCLTVPLKTLRALIFMACSLD